MHVDKKWADLDLGISTRKQEGPFCCASCKEPIKVNPWAGSPLVAVLVLACAALGWWPGS